jgi:TolA-binding protein
MKWTTVRDDLGLQDHTFGRRVTSKINQLQKFETTLAGLQKDLSNADEDDIEDLEEQIQTLKDAIKALNKELCGDMRRANSNRHNQDKITSKLKKNGAGSSDANSGEQSPAGFDNTGTPGKNPAGNQPPGTAETATTTQTTTTTSSKQQKQNPAPVKKKNTGIIVFFSIVAAGLGFYIGQGSTK